MRHCVYFLLLLFSVTCFGQDTIKYSDTIRYTCKGDVNFQVNKWELRNDSLQKRLINDIRPILANGFVFDSLFISGAASPEGSYQNNAFLARNRYRTTIDTIQNYIGTPVYKNVSLFPEDYERLLGLMSNENDMYLEYVRNAVSLDNPFLIKSALQKDRYIWNYLLKKYFPTLRSAQYRMSFHKTIEKEIRTIHDTIYVHRIDTIYIPMQGTVKKEKRLPKLSIRTNLLYDFFYMPNFGFAPSWDFHAEYYPYKGRYTYNIGITFPYWKKWNQYKFFQIEDINAELRVYYRHKDYTYYNGWYSGISIDALRYGIGFDKERGWEGEALAFSLTSGYVWQISDKWKVHFSAAFGCLYTKYDPYVYGNPFTRDESKDLYYYKYYGLKEDFVKRNHSKLLFIPTNIGISLSYDILFYKRHKLLRK